jgi:hypothetical protein
MPDKDPDKYFQSEIKRLNYYNSQFLKENDFNDEQLYHNQMRRLHNRALHTWGIVQGLEVTRVADTARVTVSPGIAIDRLGQEIVLPNTSDAKALDGFAASAKVYVTIRYADVFDINDKDIKASQTASDYYMRWTERPVVSVTNTAPDDKAPDVVLAVVVLDNQKAIAQVDRSVRRYAGSRFGSSDGGGELSIYADTAGAWHFFDGGRNADRLTIDGNGNVGIGKVPDSQVMLDVNGNIQIPPDKRIYLNLGNHGLRYLHHRADKTELIDGPVLYGWSGGALATCRPEQPNVSPEQTNVVLFWGDTGNVGIGTTSPATPLHVSSGQAKTSTSTDKPLQELATFSSNESAGPLSLKIRLKGDTDANAGNRYASLQVEDGSEKRPLLLQPGGGNVGIGITTPGFPLTFANVLGDKISLWGQSGNHYGLGIQSALLQIHTDTSAADIAFGYGASGSFTETMRVKGNGNVGIGTNDPGASKLKIAKSATDFAHLRFSGDDTGMGEFEVVGWQGGWNINTKTAGKHLYLNRDANDTSDVLIGHFGRELTVKGDTGNVKVSGSITIGDWTISGDGDNLQFSRGSSIVARFSVGQDRIQVYKNLDGKAPYFYYNKDGLLSTFNG